MEKKYIDLNVSQTFSDLSEKILYLSIFIIPPAIKVSGVYSDPYVRPFVRPSVRPSPSLIR